MTTTTPIHARAVEVARLRAERADAAADIAADRAEFDEEHAPQLERLRVLSEALAIAEEGARQERLIIYEAEGPEASKAAMCGLSIRLVNRMEYDAGDALTWAKEKGLALRLDGATFERIVRAEPSVAPFVTIKEEATATIATDMAGLLDDDASDG